MFLRIGFTTALWLLVALPAFATTMALVRTDREIALAVDSQDTVRGPGLTTFTRPICKLFEVGQTFFSVGGLIYSRANNFSAPEIIARAFRKNLPFTDNLKSAEQSIAAALKIVAEKFKETDQSSYTAITAGKNAVAVFLAAMNHETPTLAEIHFALEKQGDDLNTVSTAYLCPGDCVKNSAVRLLGPVDLINKQLKEHPGTISNATPAELAQILVQIAVDANCLMLPGRLTSSDCDQASRP